MDDNGYSFAPGYSNIKARYGNLQQQTEPTSLEPILNLEDPFGQEEPTDQYARDALDDFGITA